MSSISRLLQSWKSMFDHLAASLNIAFKWLPMFDLDQTFSSNILLHEQMFDHLFDLWKQSKPKREKAANQIQNLCDVTAKFQR